LIPLPMLISRSLRFIYLKTRKTGGTSVEIYLEPYCVDPASHAEVHNRAEAVSEWGIVGSRGSADGTWFNHMPATRIRELIGDELWDAYYKFCVVRNPFDKVVSQFWFALTPQSRETLEKTDFSLVRHAFNTWTVQMQFPSDQWVYTIKGVPVVDRFIRFERLQADLGEVCRHLAIPWQSERLGRYKGNYRRRPEPFSLYYAQESISRVRRTFAWELDHFGYSCA
jgi:hypothetical protein